MTTTADDAAMEGAFEACLAGRPVPEGAAGLATFADAARAAATRPGRPSAALADLLSTGLPPSPSGSAARPAARGRRRARRTLLAALVAKFAAAGAIAQAATGAGVVAVGLATAGFTGVLPTPVQHGFATVVDAVTPFRAPDPQQPAATAPASPADTAVPTADTPQTSAPAHPSTFGGEVGQQARDGGVDGRSVSEQAHARNDARTHGSEAHGTPAEQTPASGHAGDGSTEDSAGPSGGHGEGHGRR